MPELCWLVLCFTVATSLHSCCAGLRRQLKFHVNYSHFKLTDSAFWQGETKGFMPMCVYIATDAFVIFLCHLFL